MLQPRYVVVVYLEGEPEDGVSVTLEGDTEVATGREPPHAAPCVQPETRDVTLGPFPLWLAEELAAVAVSLLGKRKLVLARLTRAKGRAGRTGRRLEWIAEELSRLWIRRRLAREVLVRVVGQGAGDKALSSGTAARRGGSRPSPDPETMSLVKSACDGRGLLFKELVPAVALRAGGGGPPAGEVATAAEELVRRGELRRVAAVGWDAHDAPQVGRLTCRRCGGTNVTTGPCWQCGSLSCPTCQDCEGLGLARGCQPLYIGKAPALVSSAPAPPAVGLPLEGQRPPVVKLPPGVSLTPAQKEASARLAAWSEEAARRREAVAVADSSDDKGAEQTVMEECLIWAVCGAGKTEVLLEAIAAEIGRGGRVLYATPRREVTLEVGKRLEAALSGMEVSVAAGGLPGRLGPIGRLVVATAPQAVRFRAAFSLAAVDEVDAFPYPSDPMLDRAVRRALAPGGRLVYLTATPHPRLLARVERRELTVIRLLARHHGQKLPEPEVLRVGRRGSGSRETRPCSNEGEVLARLLHEGRGARTFVFVPTVQRVAEVVGALRVAGISCEGCWAADPKRPEKLASFREGVVPVLVATTVLERGVTVAGVDVIVWGADHELFAASQLVQMAGRAGRTADAPTGRVVFVVAELTGQVKRACQDIREANQLAREKGYLSPQALPPDAEAV